MINGINGIQNYDAMRNVAISGAAGQDGDNGSRIGINGQNGADGSRIGLNGQNGVDGSRTGVRGVGGDEEKDETRTGKTDPNRECQTCKRRKYQDGSNENVSFKSPTHISPNAAGSAVRAHEGEHVANAYAKAAQNGGKVLNASVRIHTAVCPECGRVYVSGGVTNTTIKYPNEDNPYMKGLKAQQSVDLTGRNANYTIS